MLGTEQRNMVGYIFCFVLCVAYSTCTDTPTQGNVFYLGERDGKSVQNVSWTFEGNLHRFKNSGVVEEFLKFHKKGLLAKDRIFNMRDPAIRAETISIIDLLFFSNDCDTMFTLVRWLYPQMNYEQFTYAQAVATLHRPDQHPGLSYVLPNWYNIFPNYFVPSNVLEDVQSQVNQGTYDSSHPPLVVPEETDGPASYFTRDVGLSNMFYNWNIYFPTWMDPQKYNSTIWKRRGEIFFLFHRQLYAHYHMRTIDSDRVWEFDYEDNILPSYSTKLHNSVGQVLATRAPNATSEDSPQRTEVKRIEDLLIDTVVNLTVRVNSSYGIKLEENNIEVISTLANLAYNTSESLNPSLYQSYYSAAVEYLASIGSDPDKDGGGVAKYPMSALSDPAFYPMLMRVNDAMEVYNLKTKSYDIKLSDADFKFESLSTDRLETFFEPYDIDVSNAVDGPAEKYIVRQLRLSHKPFTIKMNITNRHEEKRNALVSTVMLLDIFDARFMYHGNRGVYQILYRFPVQLEPGTNLLERNFEMSPIYVDEDKNMAQCGIPRRLVLPKGTEDGLKVTIVAALTPTEKSYQEPTESNLIKSPLCGGTAYNYDLPFEFPFEKRNPKMNVNLLALHNATIHHTTMTFGPGVSI